MKTVTKFPRKIETIDDLVITMPDGCKLSARMWIPKDAGKKPVPAILEHLPYRKRDGTIARDNLTHPWLAGHGYACIRVDMRGNGDSEGIITDEYTAQELDDASEVIAWAASQSWCNGNVGMMGISWGGFNALQVAALQPPALKAIITLCSTTDRYNDDIHYKGGLLLHENLGWGATMFSFSSRPPDPMLVGNKWRKMWKARLEANPMLHARWLNHQTRDKYWQHGSVCEDYAKIKAATLAVGGWGDAYKNTITALVENLDAPCKGLLGPWVHKYPHFAKPNPIGFLQEMKRWWDHWLKDEDTGVDKDPDIRMFMMDSERPKPWYETRTGTWIAENKWPSKNIKPKVLNLQKDGSLAKDKAKRFELPVSSPAHAGLHAGEYCAIYLGPELPDDQRRDDAFALCFDENPLKKPMSITGRPTVRLRLKSDKPVAQIIVRLNDIYPDGASTSITYGVMNLCQHESQKSPQKLEPDKWIDVEIKLDEIAWQIPAGNRLRLSISTNCWPLVWPSPELATLTIREGSVELPTRKSSKKDECSFEKPEAAAPWKTRETRPYSNKRWSEHDQVSGMVSLHIEDDFGEVEDLEHGLINGSKVSEKWTIHPDDPLCAYGEANWEQTNARGNWSTKTLASTSMWSDKTHFHIKGRVEAYEGKKLVFERDYEEKIKRRFI